jgi:hypothetical protein
MPRKSVPSPPTAVGSGPPGAGVPPPFEIVFRPRPASKHSVVVAPASDANEATMEFHEALRRLTRLGMAGELLVRNRQRPQHPLLRTPLKNQSQ